MISETYEYRGRHLTLIEIHQLSRFALPALHRRVVVEGMTVEEALTTPFQRQKFPTPPKHLRRHFFRGNWLTLHELARETGIPVKTIQARVDAGWTLEKALTTPVEPDPTQKAGAKKRLIGYAGRE